MHALPPPMYVSLKSNPRVLIAVTNACMHVLNYHSEFHIDKLFVNEKNMYNREMVSVRAL